MLTVKDCLQIIQERAQKQWGDKWLPELAKAYVPIAQQQGDAGATYLNRRRKIYRAFEEESCSTDTLFALIQAVNCQVQIVCTETTVIQ
jgi:hypothetical protein